MRTNYKDPRPSSGGYDHYTFLRALDAAGIGPVSVSASGVQTFYYSGYQMAGTIVPSTIISKDMVTSFHTQINKMGYDRGLIFTRDTPEVEVVHHGNSIGITFITSKYVEAKIIERKDELEETLNDFQRLNQNVPLYQNRQRYEALIDAVEKATTNDEKKKSLENLAHHFIDSLGLVPEDNVRTPSGELDIFVRNDKFGPFWSVLGTPILVECKHTKKAAGASDLRIFKDKLGNLITGFFISWNGISGKDEFHDAKKVVHDAWVLGKRMIVLQDMDFREISGGSLPEDVLYKKYVAHWKQYEG